MEALRSPRFSDALKALVAGADPTKVPDDVVLSALRSPNMHLYSATELLRGRSQEFLNAALVAALRCSSFWSAQAAISAGADPTEVPDDVVISALRSTYMHLYSATELLRGRS